MSSLIWPILAAVAVICVLWFAGRRRVPGGPNSGDASWYPAVWDDHGGPSEEDEPGDERG